MVLSAIESAPRGCLSKLVAFFTASFSSVLPGDQVTGLSSMALSKKLSNTNWMLFRDVYNRVLTSYINLLETDERLFFARFKPLKEMKELDVRVQLAKSKQSKFKTLGH